VKDTRAVAASRMALLALAAAVALMLGLWRADRNRAWETPDWDVRRFVTLDTRVGSDAVTAPDTPIWVVPVNPSCPHCMAGLARTFDARNERGSPIRLVALVVDARAAPPPARLAPILADARFWDRDGVWRHRWGHRIYGEVLVFSPGGRYLHTIAPGDGIEEALPVANLGVPPDDF